MVKPDNDSMARACQEVRPTQFLDYRKFLQEVYAWFKTHLDSYSYLQFAEDLGFSQSNMIHLAIRGKRHLRMKSVQKIVESLGLKGAERQYFETLVRYNSARLASEREVYFQRLVAIKNRTLTSKIEQSQLEYYSEWYHPVIREMVNMPDFQGDAGWIAARIQPRILPEQARKSLELLVELGLVEYSEEKQKHVLTQRNVTTGDEVTHMAVTRYHQRVIEIGRESITQVPSVRRDISGLTLSVSQEVAQKIKAEIQKFRKHLLAIADESVEPDEIVQVNIQMFPFTK
jgi:uncharacterized protein (TIGR02147 family)